MVSKKAYPAMGRFYPAMGRFYPAMGHFLLTAVNITAQGFEAIFSNFFLLTKLLTIYLIGC